MEENISDKQSGKCSFRSPRPWQKLLVYLFMIFITGCTYWGWNGIQELLYKAGSFEDLCTEDEDSKIIEIAGKHYIDCGSRKSGINNLYTIAYSAHFITSVFTGLLVDSVGPKWCYTFGQAVNLVMWILIGCLPKNPLVLRLAFFLIGVTAESLYMPLMSVSYNFPNKRSFVISLMGSARSLSFFVPSVMSFIFQSDFFKPESLYMVTTGYAIIANLSCMVVGAIMVDRKFDNTEEIGSESMKEDVSERSELSQLESGKRRNLVETVKRMLTKAFRSPQLLEYLGVVLCASLFLTAVGFINKSHREMLVTSEGDSAVDIYKYVNILTFVPAPLLGKVIDHYGAGLVLLILHSCGFMYYLCASFDVYTMKVIACVFFFFAVSLCISSTYCYINQRFPRKNFGILVGFSFLVAGLTTLTNIPLYNLGSKTWQHLEPHNFTRIAYILMSYLFVCIVTSASLYLFSRKKIQLPEEINGAKGV